MPITQFRRPIALALFPSLALAQSLPATSPTTAPTRPAAPTRPTSYPTLVDRPFYARVDAAVDRGVAFLLAHQAGDGTWASGPDIDFGQTALVTLALLSCGQSPQSPPLKRAIDFLAAAKMEHTYPVALRAAVFAQLPQANPRTAAVLRADVAWLTRINRTNKNPYPGLYTYRGPSGPDHPEADLSNSQYGVLGVWYAAEAGVEVPSVYWLTVQSAWLRCQLPDGGFQYHPRSDPGHSYGSMTTAGLTTLYLTRDYLRVDDPLRPVRRPAPATRPGGPPRDVDTAIAAAHDWLNARFSVTQNPDLADDVTVRRSLHYLFFGYERAGEASGLTRFGAHRWFEEAATAILARQQSDGSFADAICPNVDTAYALLFLSRGRSPVVLQKYVIDEHTDNRPRDANSLVRWLRRQTERHLNWQRVGPESTLPDLRESPFVYLASDRAVHLSESAKNNLRTYLDQGGLLLAVAEGKPADDPKSEVRDPQSPDPAAFTASIQSLANDLYPQYAFRDLPRSNPILAGNFPATKLDAPVLGLSNGVRELIVLVPTGDLPWQWMSAQGGAPYNDPAYALVGNLLVYLTARTGPPMKGQSHWIPRDGSVIDTTTLRVARIRFPGNWDPEPAGWERLSNLLNNRDRLNLLALPVTPDPGQLARRDFPLAHLTSTHAFTFPDQLKNGLRTYLDQHGLLLFDAAGGDPAAAQSFRDLMKSLYPKGHFRPLPPDPFYANLPSNLYRSPAPSKKVSPKSPAFEGFYQDNELLAICSPDDLSAALLATPTERVAGYTPEAAAALVENILLYATSNAPSSAK